MTEHQLHRERGHARLRRRRKTHPGQIRLQRRRGLIGQLDVFGVHHWRIEAGLHHGIAPVVHVLQRRPLPLRPVLLQILRRRIRHQRTQLAAGIHPQGREHQKPVRLQHPIALLQHRQRIVEPVKHQVGPPHLHTVGRQRQPMRIGRDPVRRTGLGFLAHADARQQPLQAATRPHVQQVLLDERLLGHVQRQHLCLRKTPGQHRQRPAQTAAQIQHRLHAVQTHRLQPLVQPTLHLGQQKICPLGARTLFIERPAQGGTVQTDWLKHVGEYRRGCAAHGRRPDRMDGSTCPDFIPTLPSPWICQPLLMP